MRILVSLLAGAALFAAPKPEFKAGVARVDITPEGSIWMSGYAVRKKPSEGVLTRLQAKALAIADARGTRVVIVTTDLIGLPRQITEEVAARAQKQWGLERSRLLFNSSHTHTGPVVRPNLETMYNLTPEQSQKVAEYSRKLREDLYAVVGGALANLEPAALEYGQGTAGFAINRRELARQLAAKAEIKLGVNPRGSGGSLRAGDRGAFHRRQNESRALRLRLPQHDADRRAFQTQRRLRGILAGGRRERVPRCDRAICPAVRRRPESAPAKHRSLGRATW